MHIVFILVILIYQLFSNIYLGIFIQWISEMAFIPGLEPEGNQNFLIFLLKVSQYPYQNGAYLGQHYSLTVLIA